MRVLGGGGGEGGRGGEGRDQSINIKRSPYLAWPSTKGWNFLDHQSSHVAYISCVSVFTPLQVVNVVGHSKGKFPARGCPVVSRKTGMHLSCL